MVKLRSYGLVALFIVLIAAEATIVQGDANGNGNGNKGNNNGSGNEGRNNGSNNEGDNNGNENAGNNNGNGNKGNGNGNKNASNNNGNGKNDDFDDVEPLPTGQERVSCKVKGGCHSKTLVCLAQCPEKKPNNNKKKGCHVDCSSKCEVTCKWKKSNCNGYGSLCYDPRFIGGDGLMFYFHGTKGGNFAIVSVNNLQVNAHFIGTRHPKEGPETSLGCRHSLSCLILTILSLLQRKYPNGIATLISIPNDGSAEWRINKEEREVIVERTDDTNSVSVRVSDLVEIDIKIRPIGKQENIVHNYQLPDDDAFAHLETQFRFKNLSDLVEGVLGKTYRPDYVSPVKIGLPMPMMGGEDKYQTPSLCQACRFLGKSAVEIARI